ncbi:MAG TPA: prepilin-type N-terminal cleavage/methylation domain-containing protein [Candidatus Ozemobacteraceae bacterium]|nr:prepilin-type N-terminal cleavage/methylation domain-containing protein [Candidatus Ozemobacteraceae bacterium]
MRCCLRKRARGFTLIEMSVVVAIIGILYFTVAPMYGSTIQKTREIALKEDLHVMRKVLDQYYRDRGAWPEGLDALVRDGYIRSIPADPITGKTDTWKTIPSEDGLADVFDIRSGATGASSDGSAYAAW